MRIGYYDYDVQLAYMLCYSHLNIESYEQTVASLEWRENEVLVLSVEHPPLEHH